MESRGSDRRVPEVRTGKELEMKVKPCISWNSVYKTEKMNTFGQPQCSRRSSSFCSEMGFTELFLGVDVVGYFL